MDGARMTDKLICVDPEKLDKIWPQVWHFIHAAFLTGLGDDTLASVHEDLQKRDALLWIVWDGAGLMAAATTKLCLVPNGKRHCVITSCAGRELPRWLRFIKELEDYAKAEGCHQMRIMGRHGWKAYFKEYGYTEPWVCLEKELS